MWARDVDAADGGASPRVPLGDGAFRGGLNAPYGAKRHCYGVERHCCRMVRRALLGTR
jgi:hypothetical protein